MTCAMKGLNSIGSKRSRMPKVANLQSLERRNHELDGLEQSVTTT